MFRKLGWLMAVAVLAPAVWAQTADEIIAKNIQARGGLDKLKSVQSIKSGDHGHGAGDGGAWVIGPEAGESGATGVHHPGADHGAGV